MDNNLPDSINIKDKNFVLRYDKTALQNAILSIANALNAAYKATTHEVICVTTLMGGLRFAAELMQYLSFPYLIDCVRPASYHGDMEASSLPTLIQPPKLDFKDRAVIFLEDIVDTGETLLLLRRYAQAQGAVSSSCAALLFKPNKFRFALPPEYVGISIEDAFVVGFGLDYDEKGRYLNGIYQLNNESP